jgi:hypothetical protein
MEIQEGSCQPLRKQRQLEVQIGEPLIDYLKRKYTIELCSTHKIGTELGVGGITVHRWLKYYKIPTRKVYAACRVRSRLDLIKDELTEEEEQVIRASLLGDGGLYTSNEKTAYFMEGHGIEQEPYLKWKQAFLTRINPVIRRCLSKKTGKLECALRTGSFECLEKIRKEYYLKEKRITRSILDKLTPLGLAIWHLDDGYLNEHGRGIRLSTCCFTIEEHNIMIDFFQQKWKLRSKIEWTAISKLTDKKYPYLKFLTEEARRLIDIIRPFVIPEMLYKINP